MLQEAEPPRNLEWADSLEHSVPETVIASAQGGCMSPELTNLHVRLSARRLCPCSFLWFEGSKDGLE